MQVNITLDVPEFFTGDPEEALRQAVIKHVGKIVSDRIEEQVQDQVVAAAMEKATGKIDSVISELLAMPIQPTNEYGEPRGEAKTLRETVIAQATTWLNQPVNDRGEPCGSSSRSVHPDSTRLAWFARRVAGDAVEKELKDAIAAAVTEIRGSVKVRAKDLLADAVAKILEQRG